MKLLFVASLTVCLLFGPNLAIATRDTVATPEERGAAFIDALNPESGSACLACPEPVMAHYHLESRCPAIPS